MSASLPSLRYRYISLTLLLALIVGLVVWFHYRDVLRTQDEVSKNLAEARQWGDQLADIRSDYIQLYQAIDMFLLDPLRGKRPSEIHRDLDETIRKAALFQKALAQTDSALLGSVAHLHGDLLQLKDSSKELFESRMDVRRQYPGMAISAFEMSAPQQDVTNGLRILIGEIESGAFKPVSAEAYPTLLKAHAIWTGEISQMRIYLANRFASFSNSILAEQSNSLEALHQQFLGKIEALKQIYAKEDSFEGAGILSAISKDAAIWHGLFQQVRRVSESENWRGDSRIMKSEIIPLLNDMTSDFLEAEHQLRDYETHISKRLDDNTTTMTFVLAVIISMFLSFIVAILISIDWLVFRPIGRVVQVLRARAFDKDTPDLSANTQEIGHLVEAFQEMDRQVSQRQNDLEHQALHDSLTGLPNRFLLNQRLEYQLLLAERSKKGFVLMLTDLNNFKDVNDSLGHLAGDALLIEVGRRIGNLVRKSDTVARLGGDEFAILLQETSIEDAEHLAQGLQESVNAPLRIGEQTINASISIGIAAYPADAGDATTLLQHADIAMYFCKRNRQAYACYNASQDFYSQNRLALSNDLRNALENDTLGLHFQPQFALDSGQQVGAEALLRWHHPEHGPIRPDKAVELAEYTGCIHQLSLWVLEKAIQQCATWHKRGHLLAISVNLSVHDLANNTLCDKVGQFLAHYNLPSRYLTLEITESGMMDNPARSIEVLKVLSQMGIKLSIDDFGTGFSSLSYLKQLPVNELKIDKSFVLDMENNPSDAVIVQSTIALGHNLGLLVVAEGIESATMLATVKSYGCDMVQGYHLGKPMPAKEFVAFVEDHMRSSK